MDQHEFDHMILDLKAGGDLFLAHLYNVHRNRCIDRLCSEHQCSRMDAEDCFSESVLVARRAAFQNRLMNNNLGGFLYTVCYRVFLRKIRSVAVHDKAISNLKISNPSYVEQLNHFENAAADKHAELNAAFDKLSDPCKHILKSFYLDLQPLKDLQEALGYKSYDTMKTTKKRCFEKLKSLMKGGGKRV